MTTGERIKAARKKAGITQAQLAEQSGVATISIHQYEAGKRNPQLEPVLRIASALGVSVDSLIDATNRFDVEDMKDAIIYGGPIGRVVENMQQLNLAGRERVEAYSADMLKIAEYREERHPDDFRPKRKRREPLRSPEDTDTASSPKGSEEPQDNTLEDDFKQTLQL